MPKATARGRGVGSTSDSAPPRRQRQPPTMSECQRRIARRRPHDAEPLHEPQDVVGHQDPHFAAQAPEDVAGGDQGMAGDQAPFPGGPIDGSLLTDYQHHVAYQIWQGQVYIWLLFDQMFFLI